ncbi:oxidoreductase [Amniculicola lignicola CBS 123094]|uniref:Oxidoreductase n=1 Tax=Amniculicola lignicola CBS 123094 TaxID=1392246 RepID=A0A6A5VY56_9PLEO|nr:oxidoreductase [Amniculicola lignicola CBS 123094]
MSFPYKHTLLIGATSGIGAAIATKLISSGVKVTAVGRRKDRLDEFVKQHGADKASSIVFDIADLEKTPTFAAEALKNFPTIDSLFLNAGMQRNHNFSTPSDVSLSTFDQEILTNFTSFVHLTHAFLPTFLAAKDKRGIIFTGSHLSIVPASPMPGYSASKAALDAFFVCIRAQLKKTNVEIIHLSPPMVQSELHDTTMSPEHGRAMGMPAPQFVEEAYAGLVKGDENIFIGTIPSSSQEQVLDIAEKRLEAFERLEGFLESMSS